MTAAERDEVLGRCDDPEVLAIADHTAFYQEMPNEWVALYGDDEGHGVTKTEAFWQLVLGLQWRESEGY